MTVYRPPVFTRSVRRELAACIQRLLETKTRWPMHVRSQSDDHWVLGLLGWPDAVNILVGIQTLCMHVVYQNQNWDALFWPDVQPQFQQGHWRCAELDCPLEGRSHTKLQDLLWDHLCDPLLQYLNSIPPNSRICLYGGEAVGYTAAQIEQTSTRPRHTPVICWPITEF